MSVRVKIIGSADGRGTTVDGWYLVSCDVNENNGRGSIIATPVAEDATVFDDVAKAMEYWMRRSTKVPTRPDGKPNRPLTAYTIEVEKID